MPTQVPNFPLPEIRDRLDQGAAPTDIIEQLTPRSRDAGAALARRLPLWDEYRGEYSDQVIAIARVLSLRAMGRFGLAFDNGVRLVTSTKERGGSKPRARPSWRFSVPLSGESIDVVYTPDYFPDRAMDLFSFVSPHDPPQPHALSPTGYWSQFVPRDAVDACGGPERYATFLATARLAGSDATFASLFEGTPDPDPGPASPATGAHAARAAANRADRDAGSDDNVGQRSLF
jgi:hypothetical protein